MRPGVNLIKIFGLNNINIDTEAWWQIWQRGYFLPGVPGFESLLWLHFWLASKRNPITCQPPLKNPNSCSTGFETGCKPVLLFLFKNPPGDNLGRKYNWIISKNVVLSFSLKKLEASYLWETILQRQMVPRYLTRQNVSNRLSKVIYLMSSCP